MIDDALFTPGRVEGVQVVPLRRRADARGWLMEAWRLDDLPGHHRAMMAYVSETLPGVTRGPHEHREQADWFVFAGPGTFRLTLWDVRAASPTWRVRHVVPAGADLPTAVLVPPGVAHAYTNVGGSPGWVWNLPDRLYGGWGRQGPVDEIRHEDGGAA